MADALRSCGPCLEVAQRWVRWRAPPMVRLVGEGAWRFRVGRSWTLGRTPPGMTPPGKSETRTRSAGHRGLPFSASTAPRGVGGLGGECISPGQRNHCALRAGSGFTRLSWVVLAKRPLSCRVGCCCCGWTWAGSRAPARRPGRPRLRGQRPGHQPESLPNAGLDCLAFPDTARLPIEGLHTGCPRLASMACTQAGTTPGTHG